MIKRLTVKGFKSIDELQNFELNNLNIFIGGNGAGKSNLIDFFRLLRVVLNDNLDTYIRSGGGISDFLYNGRKRTSTQVFEIHFDSCGYRFFIKPGLSENCLLTNEAYYNLNESQKWREFGENSDNRSQLKQVVKRNTLNNQSCKHIFDMILSWGIYHFHDTSEHAAMRHYEIIQDNKVLRVNASNIAPYLMRLKNEHQSIYQEIIQATHMVLPFFEDFLLDFTSFGEKQKVNLSWVQKGSDFPLQPYHFSDGSIRFICLATALLQPDPPSTIIIDEPELGLHPSAIAVLAELIQNSAKRTQIIIATQSPTFIDYFGISDIIVVNRESGASTFNRLKEKDFNIWLEDYSVGELWSKNVITGGPAYE